MNIIKSVTKFFIPESNSMAITTEVEMFSIYAHHHMIDEVVRQVTEAVAKAYVEQHGAEILKHINEKTIDAKVIQKVVANLRKELSDATNETR